MIIKINFADIQEFVNIPDKTIVLAARESRTIDFEVTAHEDKRPDAYFGVIEVERIGDAAYNLRVEKDERTEKVGIVIIVKEREALFDIITRMITSVVTPGNDAKASISMTNIGIGDADVILYYSIVDFANNTLVFKTETIKVETIWVGGVLDVERSLQLPIDAIDQNYIFYAKVMYDESVAASANVFVTSSEPRNWLPLIAVILLVMIIILIKLYKRRHSS